MAFAEKRGNLWRARWRAPDGTMPSKPGFRTRKAAEKYGQAQEAAVDNGTYIDHKAGQITLTEWVNVWFPAQDLELNTLDTYKSTIEIMILPEFGHRSLKSIEEHPEEVAAWEKKLYTEGGYQRRTAREARSTLTNILNDAIPRYIKANPAARKRGKGRKGQRRIEQAEKAEKVWATALEALLFAERCAVLSGDDSDFVMMVTAAYTAARWSELMGLSPEDIRESHMGINWKLYELNGRFYRGRPKDGSIRSVDIPPFLHELLMWQIRANPKVKCTCRNTDRPWCPGLRYVFLAPGNTHHRRSNYSSRIVRPAADGQYPARDGRFGRLSMPVLVDASAPFPGVPLPPWPPAVEGEAYAPPTGRGRQRLVVKDGFGRCQACARSTALKLDGTLIRHESGGEDCPGSLRPPAELPPPASWLPLLPGLTPHGLRHGHQTWLDDLNVRYALQAERMGHEVPGMRGVYSHIADEWRADLIERLQERWEASLDARACLSAHSAVPLLDDQLAARRKPAAKPLRSRFAPRIGH